MGVVRRSAKETAMEVPVEGDWGNIALVASHVTVIDAKTLFRDVRTKQARWAPREPKCLPTCPSSTTGSTGSRRAASKQLEGRPNRSGCARPLITSALVTLLQGLVLLVPYHELTNSLHAEPDLAFPSLDRALDAAKGVLWGSSSIVQTEWPVCVSGQAVPRIYLLGAARSATSSVADDLVGAGAVFTFPGLKESDIFMNVCKYTGCPAPSEGERETFLSAVYNRSCLTRQKTILEATPGDLGLSGLPPLLSALYGDQAKRVGFVVLYREPMARAHSNWWLFRTLYHRFPTLWYIYHPLTSTFAGYLALQEPKVQKYKADGYKGMAEDFNVVLIYQSLYSLALHAWFQAFNSDQFAIVPMGYYVSSTRTRNAVIGMLASKFGATFSADRFWGRQVTHKTVGGHPPLVQEVNQSTMVRWYAQYFRPDLRHLAKMLAENVPLGLTVAGYPGEGGSGPSAAEEMFAYLCEVFSCMA